MVKLEFTTLRLSEASERRHCGNPASHKVDIDMIYIINYLLNPINLYKPLLSFHVNYQTGAKFYLSYATLFWTVILKWPLNY